MLNRRNFIFSGIALAAASQSALAGSAPGSAADKLFQLIDAMDVENHWPAGVHVDWETGIPDGKPIVSEGKHTHCSAFVASAAEKLGIYILRPPDHGQVLLANAQNEWLQSDGASEGWKQLPDMYAAQDAANKGLFVVASYHNHNDDKPGHIAIVRPSDKSRQQIEAEGPDITQAGLDNFTRTTVKKGFADHKSAFAGDEILYFAHVVDKSALPN